MGAGVGRLYLHTVRPATAMQSDQTQRRTPVPSQAADMHTDKPQTHTHTVRPQTASPETVAHVFTQSGNRGGRMQNQTNKTCTESDHTRRQAQNQTSDTQRAVRSGTRDTQPDKVPTRATIRQAAGVHGRPAGDTTWRQGRGLRCVPAGRPDPLTHRCVQTQACTDYRRTPGAASCRLSRGDAGDPSAALLWAPTVGPLRAKVAVEEGGGPSWPQGAHGNWPHPQTHIRRATSGEGGSVPAHLGQLGGPQRDSGETKEA